MTTLQIVPNRLVLKFKSLGIIDQDKFSRIPSESPDFPIGTVYELQGKFPFTDQGDVFSRNGLYYTLYNPLNGNNIKVKIIAMYPSCTPQSWMKFGPCKIIVEKADETDEKAGETLGGKKRASKRRKTNRRKTNRRKTNRRR
jgi:hypothetical protein